MTDIFKNGPNSPGHLHPRAWGKTTFWDRLWTLSEHISSTEYYINNRNKSSMYRNSPTCPKFGKIWSRNGWERLASFCSQPCVFRMSLITHAQIVFAASNKTDDLEWPSRLFTCCWDISCSVAAFDIWHRGLHGPYVTTELLVTRGFFWCIRFLLLVFPYFFISVPCARLGWRSHQLLSAH